MRIENKIFLLDIRNSIGWFRFLKFGIYYKNINTHNMNFSERMGIKKYIKIGNFIFRLLDNGTKI